MQQLAYMSWAGIIVLVILVILWVLFYFDLKRDRPERHAERDEIEADAERRARRRSESQLRAHRQQLALQQAYEEDLARRTL